MFKWYIRNLKNLCEKINQSKIRNNINDINNNINTNNNNNNINEKENGNIDDINCNLNCLNSNPVIISEMQKSQKSEDSLFNY